ncbi:hypothetical protein PMG11_01968 [Penicillium brasilianum]|uniref:HNH nuclease domain-containing protein n=1 Tax=Penicillium brasilianum TaxID=104259 RepID=A0A0F7TGR2_PENBI|nr:hypothetical protein PMG11_01968 [Penicillium brasilianum]
MILVRHNELRLISRACLFTLWFSDKAVLRQIAHGENGWNPSLIVCRLSSQPYLPFDPVGRIAKGRRDEMADKTPGARDPEIAEKASERDGEECVMTKHERPGLKIAYIVPFHLHQTPGAGLWALLRDFSGAGAEAWKHAIIGATDNFNTEQATNLMALNRLLYVYWEDCSCEFRPVRVADDGMSMDVAFHWLPLPSGKKTNMIPIDRNPFGLGAEKGLLKSPGLNLKIFNHETDRVICSGDVFTIRTTDKEKLPLPSMELLEMLWILKRIARMQGGEDEEDDAESDKDSSSQSRSRSASPYSLSLDERVLGDLAEESGWQGV